MKEEALRAMPFSSQQLNLREMREMAEMSFAHLRQNKTLSDK